MKYKTFETERLFIRPTSEKDAEFILELFNTPKWIENIGDRNINSVEDAKDYINQNMISQLIKLGYSNYTLIRKIDNEKIGSCGLYDREGLEGIDIGFAFLPKYEKKGFAFEAANRLKQAAFNDFGIELINAITAKNNTSSQKLLEKLGLKFNKLTCLPNDDEELLLYTLKREHEAQ